MSKAHILVSFRTEKNLPANRALTGYAKSLLSGHPDSRAGVVESLQDLVEYQAECFARLLELLALGGCNLREPRHLNYILFGSEAGAISDVQVMNPTESDDDIPF